MWMGWGFLRRLENGAICNELKENNLGGDNGSVVDCRHLNRCLGPR
jgi:hypothetical protein